MSQSHALLICALSALSLDACGGRRPAQSAAVPGILPPAGAPVGQGPPADSGGVLPDTGVPGGAGGSGAPGGSDGRSASPDLGSVVDAAPAGVTPDVAPAAANAAADLVNGLDLQSFRNDIKTIASGGDRTQGSASYGGAATWLEQQLVGAGYTVEHHDYTFMGGPRSDIFVTKVGTRSPDRMYIVSAHFDGRGAGGAADDDGSGVALVLEVARSIGRKDVEADTSVRFAFWDNEETGLQGSRAYVTDRTARQGVEDPPGSHRFPEPRWLGMIQHDMILFDHGLPPGPMQSPTADIDVEYQISSKQAAASRDLAAALAAANVAYAKDYPVQVGGNMSNTDSEPFQDITAAVSVRENQRLAEIGRGSNPNYHRPTDLYETYSDADFRFGFTSVKTTLAAVAVLSGARIVAPR
jgi:hypothetical protein